jgi:hypothetical protein
MDENYQQDSDRSTAIWAGPGRHGFRHRCEIEGTNSDKAADVKERVTDFDAGPPIKSTHPRIR